MRRRSPLSFSFFYSLLLLAPAIACTSTVVGTGTGSPGGSDASGSGSPNEPSTTSSDPCRPGPGIYSVHFAKQAGSSLNCETLADDTTYVTEVQPDGGVGSFLKRAHEVGCEVTANSVSCLYSIHCDQMNNGTRVISDSTLDTSTSTPTGASTVVAAGAVCKYSITWTKR